jgi:putative peptide zinc metalloprotease protein
MVPNLRSTLSRLKAPISLTEAAAPPKYARDTHITVYPYHARADGDDAIIANYDRTSFLSVPAEAVELLEQFARGLSVGEVQDVFQQKNGVQADLDDFIDMLAAEHFLTTRAGGEIGEYAVVDTRRYHFENLSVDVARRFVSPLTLILCGVLTAAGVIAAALEPAVLPPATALVFDADQVGVLLSVLALSVAGVWVHELAHLVAARAAGAPSRIGFGNRLWYLVAETDMTGIWLASRAQRCLAFLAGPLVDLASAAFLVLLLIADRAGWLHLDATVVAIVRGVLFMYLARLVWQFQFFVPTDLYYVVGAAFGCKNLMGDTQAYLLNLVARILPRIRARDLSGLPARELRVVRAFAVFWVLGRAVAFGTLVWITLPVLAGYALVLARGVVGDTGDADALAQGPLMPAIAVALQVVGLTVWIRKSLTLQRSKR